MCLERVSHMKFSIKSAYGGQPQVMYICMDTRADAIRHAGCYGRNIDDVGKCIIISSSVVA